MNNIRMLTFDISNYKQYKSVESKDLHRFKSALPRHTIEEYNKIYLLMYKPRFLKEFLIGRCVVTDTTKICDENYIKHLPSIYNIPLEIILEYPVFIEDFYIHEKYRGRGYSKTFANYVLNDLGPSKISLKAQDDGLWFWKKYGFKSKENDVFVIG